MKNYFKFLVIALAGVFTLGMTACNNEKPEDPVTVDPDSLTFPAVGGKQKVTVTGEGWSADSDDQWIDVADVEGGIEVTVGATTEKRTGSVKVVKGDETKTVAVTQNAPGELLVSSDSLEFTAEDENAQTVTVTSAEVWNATTTDGWIKITDITETTFKISVDENTTDGPRTGEVTVTNGGDTKTVTVEQGDLTGYRFIYAKSGYYGAAYGEGTTNFYVQLHGFNLDATGAPKGDGYWLTLDIISEAASLDNIYVEIAPGTYTFTDTEGKNTVNTGGEDTSLQFVEDGLYDTKAPRIVEGTLEVRVDGYEYTMKVDVTLDNGTQFKGYYVGPINVPNPSVRSTLTGDVEFPTLNSGTLVSYGDLLGIGVYTYYTTMFGGGDVNVTEDLVFSGTGYMVVLEINSGGDGTSIADGTYDINESLFQAGNIFVGGMNGPTRSGSWYYRIENGRITNVATLMSGQVEIAYADNAYTMSIDAADADGHGIKGGFQGGLKWFDIILPTGNVAAARTPLAIQAPFNTTEGSKKAAN